MERGKLKQIADAVGVTPGFITHIKNGRKRPGWPVAKKLEHFTGIPVAVWMEGKENPGRLRRALEERFPNR